MGELQFAKQFLTSLDSKSTKYQAGHVFDPKDFQTRIPYTLPRLSHPPHPQPPTSNTPSTPPPGSTAAAPSINIILKSTRNPALTLTLTSLDPTNTTIHSLKESVQSTLGGPSVVGIEKIKILLSKKPVPTSKKTIAEALDGVDVKQSEVEFGVMIMGGAPDPPPQATPQTMAPGPGSKYAAADPVTTPTSDASAPMEGVVKAGSPPAMQPDEVSGKAMLDSAEFWDDLQGYLGQRMKDETEAKWVRGVFEKAWKASG